MILSVTHAVLSVKVSLRDMENRALVSPESVVEVRVGLLAVGSQPPNLNPDGLASLLDTLVSRNGLLATYLPVFLE